MKPRLAALALAIAACTRREAPPAKADASPPTSISSASASVAIVDAGPPPLEGMPWIVDLAEGRDDLGKLCPPLGAREPRPVVVALHGGGDRPEWACGEWRSVAKDYPVVVCPRGIGATTSLAWSSPANTKRAIDRALAAARARIGAYMREGPMVLVGFSMGATQAAILGREDPARFPRVALSENGYDPGSSAAFANGYKGERVLLSCTTGGCEPVYRSAASVLTKRGVPVRVNQSGTGRHGIFLDVIESLQRDWPWFVEGMEGWGP